MARQLFELVGSDPARRFSPYCWRSRMALAHKGLDAEIIPWRFTETARLAAHGGKTVPILLDGDAVVTDSWDIALHLERAHPAAAALFQGPPETYRFIAAWTDTVVSAGVARLIVSDIVALLGEADAAYFTESREKRFGMKLTQVTADREARLPEFRASLAPLRRTLGMQPFLGGAQPDYADYIVFGSFMWARVVSPFALLAEDDAVFAWHERLLDLHGGLARAVPAMTA
ncbi:glutathione S-transferase family protein [Sediminicoccus sp. KRV36]|uniref:glutathione S-transferase family protein n=1 Tax=Sediminicoccus sp. KRV36 TaxID=3133721 RepID=UPI00200BAF8D|nr:glutathione S-transferase family protein [Sediminicoccus rosea]UPY35259.1 glutathione S-transferase family protein [Sediminicoccus rosea]